MSDRVTIVHALPRDWLGRRYGAAIVYGTIGRYYPAAATMRRWTAAGAKRAGDRIIARRERQETRRLRREHAARKATGY